MGCFRVKAIDPAKRSALQKINYYLEVNKIDYTIRRSPKGNKNVSQGQQNRLHHKKSTAKNKFASRSSKSTSPTRAPIKREANKNQKESLKTEGQKAILYYYETKTTPYSHKTTLAIN